ncbi:hypothetical protein ACILD7_02365 [Capnocytophaga canimorsus]|uniref:hypothetical protein n=1 Tax=Capnocytophaga canimorsus TaxID=28188 RepID=UPI0037D33EAE
MNNEQLTITQNQSSAELPQVRLQEVLQAGQTNEISFVKSTFSQTALREQRTPQTIETLAIVLTKSAVLTGIKQGVEDAVKEDLKDLIFGKFGGLSLEEVAYAFKLERQLAYPTKSEHYQFFSTEYVAEILGKYTEWKAEKRRQHHLEPETLNLKPKTMTAQDKVLLFLTGIMNAFEYFKADNQLRAGDTQYCDGLYHLGLLVPTSQQLEELNERTFQELRQELAKTNDRKEHSQIKEVIHGMLTDDIKFKIKRRKLLLADFFTELIGQGKSISEAIQPKIEGKSYEEILKILKI